MFCPNCGTDINADVKFCPKCGGAVSKANTPAQGNTNSSPTYGGYNYGTGSSYGNGQSYGSGSYGYNGGMPSYGMENARIPSTKGPVIGIIVCWGIILLLDIVASVLNGYFSGGVRNITYYLVLFIPMFVLTLCKQYIAAFICAPLVLIYNIYFSGVELYYYIETLVGWNRYWEYYYEYSSKTYYYVMIAKTAITLILAILLFIFTLLAMVRRIKAKKILGYNK